MPMSQDEQKRHRCMDRPWAVFGDADHWDWSAVAIDLAAILSGVIVKVIQKQIYSPSVTVAHSSVSRSTISCLWKAANVRVLICANPPTAGYSAAAASEKQILGASQRGSVRLANNLTDHERRDFLVNSAAVLTAFQLSVRPFIPSFLHLLSFRLVALFVLVFASMPSFYSLMGVDPSGFDPDHRFTTSWLLPPAILAAYRILFGLFGWASLAVGWYDYGTTDPVAVGREFSYFTNLTWWGVTLYMCVSGVHTVVYTLRGESWLHRWPRPLQALHSLFYTTIVVYPFLVTIVYWGILYKAPWFTNEFDAFRNVSRHGTNSLAALLEIILPATNPMPWLHIPFVVLLLAMYLGLAYVTHATQGWYPYGFLNPANGAGQLAAYVVGILVAGLIIFLIVWGIIWVRRRFTGVGKKSKRDPGGRGHYSHTGDIEMRAK